MKNEYILITGETNHSGFLVEACDVSDAKRLAQVKCSEGWKVRAIKVISTGTIISF